MIIELAPIFLRLLEKSSLSSKTYFSCGNLCNDFLNVFLLYHTRSTIMKCKKAKKVTFSKDYRFARGTQLINHSIMSKVNKSRIIEKNSIMKPIIDSK